MVVPSSQQRSSYHASRGAAAMYPSQTWSETYQHVLCRVSGVKRDLFLRMCLWFCTLVVRLYPPERLKLLSPKSPSWLHCMCGKHHDTLMGTEG